MCKEYQGSRSYSPYLPELFTLPPGAIYPNSRSYSPYLLELFTLPSGDIHPTSRSYSPYLLELFTIPSGDIHPTSRRYTLYLPELLTPYLHKYKLGVERRKPRLPERRKLFLAHIRPPRRGKNWLFYTKKNN